MSSIACTLHSQLANYFLKQRGCGSCRKPRHPIPACARKSGRLIWQVGEISKRFAGVFIAAGRGIGKFHQPKQPLLRAQTRALVRWWVQFFYPLLGKQAVPPSFLQTIFHIQISAKHFTQHSLVNKLCCPGKILGHRKTSKNSEELPKESNSIEKVRCTSKELARKTKVIERFCKKTSYKNL